MFVQHWKWRQAKESREVWYVSWSLRVLEHPQSIDALECCRTESSFCMITPVPILPIWWGINFRDLAGKYFNIIRTVLIYPHVTSTILAIWRKIFMDVGFIRTRKCKSEWGCGSISDLPLSTRLELIVSQWDKCINTSCNYFWIKQIPLSLCSGCSLFIWLPLICSC